MTTPAPHLTALEHAWSKVPAGHRVSLKRTDNYDPLTGLYHSPPEYVHIPVDHHTFRITEDELVSRLFGLVHPGLSDDDMPIQCPTLQTRERRNTISEDVLRRLLRNSESSLVFGGTIDNLVEAYRDDRALQIQALLCHPLLGNRKNRDYVQHDDLSEVVSSCLHHRLPFQLVLPAFPFKDQNPFRTSSGPSHWDIGEAALLIRLHCIALGLNQLHPYDGECLILSDGIAYASIFGVRVAGAAEYLRGLRELRNTLNLQRTVHLIDLRFVMDKLDKSFTLDMTTGKISGLRRIIQYFEDQLEALGRSNDQVAGQLSTLGQSMVWNLDTRDYIVRSGARELWRAMNPKCGRLDQASMELRRELSNRGWRAGLRYSAFSIALAATKFWPRVFPNSIRATVHGKPSQALIPKLGRGDPWNAVGVIEHSELGPASIRTLPLWKLRHGDYYPVYFADSADPIAYVRKSLMADLANW